MNLLHTYSIEEKIKSLSERLRILALDRNSYSMHVNQEIKSQNLQYNLSLIISKIVENLQSIERDEAAFKQTINEYNINNGTTLSIIDFEEIGWIRHVHGEVVIPNVISNFIWKIGYDESEGKPIEIPQGKNDLILCLQKYYKKYFENTKLTISRYKLDSILKEYSNAKEIIESILEKGILSTQGSGDLLCWKDNNDYSRHLRNEIASTLWLLICGDNATEDDFKRYFKLINSADIWIDDLKGFLTLENTNKISDLAISYLNAETDLLESSNDFRKFWLDAESFNHIHIEDEIPYAKFNYENTFEFIESVTYHKWRFRDLFSRQRTRSYSLSLLRISILSSAKPEDQIIKILKDVKRPWLLWMLYTMIPREFPWAIPHLLREPILISISFKLLRKIEVDKLLLPYQESYDTPANYGLEIRNNLYLEMYDLVLEELKPLYTDSVEKAQILIDVLLDLAEETFTYNSNDRNGQLTHELLTQRYEESIRRLAEQKDIFFALPDILVSLEKHFESKFPNHTEFLNLKIPLLDLSIRIIKLNKHRSIGLDFPETRQERINSSVKSIVKVLYQHLINYYSQTEIKVQSYVNPGVENRRAKRGIRTFGYEVIEWDLLFMLFEENHILQNFHNEFTSTLNFNVGATEYDEENSDQREKIKLYITALLLGFISIHKNKLSLEISEYEIKATLSKLEMWIKELSLTYNLDDVSNERVDIFRERYSIMGFDFYYKDLMSLLLNAINYFNFLHAEKFITEYFDTNSDMGRMLKAINTLESREIQQMISKRISRLDINTFIKHSSTTTELQDTLIDAINSEMHWELSKPLLEKIQKHFKRVNHNDENTNHLLFQVELLLAFKEKDFERLTNIQVPEYNYPTKDKMAVRVKDFYIGVFKLYNDKNFDESIRIFESILLEDKKNVRAAFQLYRAETLKALEDR